jgi:hypothetical protein
MIRPGENVLLDTTAIIEAHRQGVWEPLVNGFRLATVEKCIEEIDTGRLRMVMTVCQMDDATMAEAVPGILDGVPGFFPSATGTGSRSYRILNIKTRSVSWEHPGTCGGSGEGVHGLLGGSQPHAISSEGGDQL